MTSDVSPDSSRVLKRYVALMVVATVVMFGFWAVIRQFSMSPPGDYEVRQGDIFLSDGEYAKAIERFNAALDNSPNHRGALIGRGIAFTQLKKYPEAKAEFTYVIKFLSRNLEPDDATGKAALAAAYANRGIINDRTGRYKEALADYVSALKIDEEITKGPGLVDKIIYGTPKPATVRQRAIYIEKQLALPKDKRLLRIPEIDEKQRMYKP